MSIYSRKNNDLKGEIELTKRTKLGQKNQVLKTALLAVK